MEPYACALITVAHENITLLSQPSEEFDVACQPPRKPDLGHLDHFLP